MPCVLALHASPLQQGAGCKWVEAERFRTLQKLGTRSTLRLQSAERVCALINQHSVLLPRFLLLYIFAASVASHTSRGKAGSSP